MPYRCDFYSDEEYRQACILQEELAQKEIVENEIAMREYEEECAYQEFLKENNTAQQNNKGDKNET